MYRTVVFLVIVSLASVHALANPGHKTGERCTCMPSAQCAGQGGVGVKAICIDARKHTDDTVCCYLKKDHEKGWTTACGDEGGACFHKVVKPAFCAKRGGTTVSKKCPGGRDITCCAKKGATGGSASREGKRVPEQAAPVDKTEDKPKEYRHREVNSSPAKVRDFSVLFLHGAGEKGRPGNSLSGSWYTAHDAWTKKYWGRIAERITREVTPHFQSYFVHTDTTSRGWTSKRLVTIYCDAIESKRPHVIVTHSMANNIVAYGIQKGISGCKLIGTGENDVKWLQSQGPLEGSSAGDFLAELCVASAAGHDELMRKFEAGSWYHANLNKIWGTPKGALGHVWDAVSGSRLKALAASKALAGVFKLYGEFAGDCDKRAGKTHLPAPLYLSLMPRTCRRVNLKATATKYATGSICGVQTSVTGCCEKAIDAVENALPGWLTGKSSDQYEELPHNLHMHSGLHALSKLVKWRTKSGAVDRTDGLVGEFSCRLTNKPYSQDPKHPWYLVDGDHIDGTFRDTQDGSGRSRTPQLWLLNQLRAILARLKANGSAR
eukprot:TRINITY_DN33213_c0_g1_i1.p1 TRINITY_DN33213_c0_g1~~TRINITY_DN33213_c0_g1_i1.p1  ORF type:complete len:548 (+),score=104.78 TRINITY_DN33213_c0_g1_i1:58-1701(+)